MTQFIVNYEGRCQYLTPTGPGRVEIGDDRPGITGRAPTTVAYGQVTRGILRPTRLVLKSADGARTVIHGINQRSQQAERIGLRPATAGVFAGLTSTTGTVTVLDSISLVISVILFPWALWLFCSAYRQTTLLARALRANI